MLGVPCAARESVERRDELPRVATLEQSLQARVVAEADADAAWVVVLVGDHERSVGELGDRGLRRVARQHGPEAPVEQVLGRGGHHGELAVDQRVVHAQVAALADLDDLERVEPVAPVVHRSVAMAVRAGHRGEGVQELTAGCGAESVPGGLAGLGPRDPGRPLEPHPQARTQPGRDGAARSEPDPAAA